MSEINELKLQNLVDFNHTISGELLKNYEYPWQVLPEIKSIILSIGETLDANEFDQIEENIWVHKTAKIAKTASISSPCIICANAEIRHCAFIRGSALVGENCVVGNSVELKNVILFDNVQVPHYNYVGDSILGYKSHMGAGSITSNVKSDKKLVTIKFETDKIETALKKFGAILGDNVEVGCNSVLNPGTVVGKNTNLYPLTLARGYYPANSIVKNTDTVVKKVDK